MTERPVYTVDEVAEMLGVNRRLVYSDINDEKIPHIRVGRRILVPKIAFERWLESAGEAA